MSAPADIDLKRRAFALLREALEREPAQRVAFAQAQAGTEPALLALLLQLLHTEDTPHLLDAGAARLAERLAGEAEDELAPGTQVGGWTIQRRLGRGGMGSVFLAVRDGDGYVQQGALKWIKRGMDSGEILARFRRERRILAQLQHPRIARLLDGGVGESGQPWFVMEFVDGMPLNEWAATPRLTLGQRLDLFVQLAEAVAYAHGQLVVHRDLKPGNVLVDSDGQPHLLDFGVAKVLEEDDTGAMTATGARFLSRAYAAPEQLRGEHVGTAVDVYALGVLLFELLSGARFHDNPVVAAGATSDRLSRAAAAAGAGIAPRRLRGDLGIIVARATDADPQRRYATAQALADDVRSYLRGAPIRARRDSGWYRLHRYVGRHRFASAALALAVFGLVGGGALALSQAHRAAREAELARAAQRFLTGVFDASSPDAAAGARVTARELLDQGVARIDQDLHDQPALQAQMRQTLGTLYRQLGQYTQAATLLEQAQAQFAAAGAREALLDNRLELARVRREQAQYPAALALLDEAATLATDPPRRSEVLAERSQVQDRQGDYALSLESARAAAALSATLGPDGARAQARDRRLEALQLTRLGRYDEADAAFRDAIARSESAYGREHSAVADVRNDYAILLIDRQASSDAEREARAALAIRRKRLGPQHVAVAESLKLLGSTLRQQGRLDEAGAALDEALSVQRAGLGPRHPDVASTLNSLATLAMGRQDFGRMVELLGEAREIYREQGLGETAQGLTLDSNLGVGLTRLERFDEAEPLLRAALARHRASVGDVHPLVMASLNGLSQLERRRGNAAAAVSLAEEAVAIADRLLAESRDNAGVRQTLAAAQLLAGRAQQAQASFGASIAVLDKLGARAEPRYATALLGLAQAELALGRPAAAAELARRCLSEGAAVGAGSAGAQVLAQAILAAAEKAQGRAAAARVAQQQARELITAWTNPDPEVRRQVDGFLTAAAR